MKTIQIFQIVLIGILVAWAIHAEGLPYLNDVMGMSLTPDQIDGADNYFSYPFYCVCREIPSNISGDMQTPNVVYINDTYYVYYVNETGSPTVANCTSLNDLICG